MENIGMIFPLIMMVGLGIAIGIYISTQIKCHIRKNIMNNNLKNYENRELRKRYEETAVELDELHVTVNGHKYKVI